MEFEWDNSFSNIGTSCAIIEDGCAIYTSHKGKVFFYYKDDFVVSFKFESQEIAKAEVERAFS